MFNCAAKSFIFAGMPFHCFLEKDNIQNTCQFVDPISMFSCALLDACLHGHLKLEFFADSYNPRKLVLYKYLLLHCI